MRRADQFRASANRKAFHSPIASVFPSRRGPLFPDYCGLSLTLKNMETALQISKHKAFKIKQRPLIKDSHKLRPPTKASFSFPAWLERLPWRLTSNIVALFH
ncbi:unnamed protein product [Prunus armeniaca]